jgi:mono/diheme cytochrome c family protein
MLPTQSDFLRRRRFMSIGSLLAIALSALLLGVALAQDREKPSSAAEQAAFEQSIQPLLKQYCLPCHGAQRPAGGVNLAAVTDVASLQRDQATWRKVLSQVRERHMPPSNAPQPSPEQRELLASWLQHTLNNVDESLLPRDPGRAPIRRLSRLEYNYTVQDLFGVTSRPADRFPADGGGGAGFDNNADTLFLPPILMERYLEAASEVLAEAKPERLFIARPEKGLSKPAAARRILEHFAFRAYRRPVEKAEIDRLLRLYHLAAKRGDSFEESVRFALKAVLVSPNFLFRVEANPKGGSPAPVSDYELATRLSYFLWASMPDEELFRLAGQGRLRDPKTLEQQALRMLKDPKARRMAESFASQWLKIKDLYASARPDPAKFPAYTPSIRDAMYHETVAFFHSLLREDGSLLSLIDADYTYLNEELANYYGIAGVRGPDMRRVRLSDRTRGGVLTMGSVLTVTSYPQRTSPVLRGKWVLEEILGAPPPPPPPNAGALSPDDAPREGLTFRQRLEQHRKKPECASCHNRMDPIGFGLENFDAAGRWRRDIGGVPVDATGVLATGEKFEGPVQLKKVLMNRKDDFIRNLTEKMLAYALGRGLEPYDLPTVRRITQAVERENYRSSTLILEIVKSYPFQYRKSR